MALWWLIALWLFAIFSPWAVRAANREAFNIKNYLEEDIKIIWCYNKHNHETRKTTDKWNCHYWNWWFNIMLPPKSHATARNNVFNWNAREIINRLPVVNFESSFRPDAENSIAIWYVQTLKRRQADTSIEWQLEWMKSRMNQQKTQWTCSYTKWSSEEMILRCLYKRHYWQLSDRDRYPERMIRVRNYYYDYFENN